MFNPHGPRHTTAALLGAGILLLTACGGGGGGGGTTGTAPPPPAAVDRTWGMGALIDDGTAVPNDGSDVASIDSNATGHTYVAWSRPDASGSNSDIWVNYYAPGTGWLGPQAVESAAGFASSPQIAVAADGNATLVWAPGGGGGLLAKRTTAPGQWDAAAAGTRIDNGLAGDPRASLAGAPDGSAIAVWNQLDAAAEPSVWFNRYTPSGGWGTAALAEQDPVIPPAVLPSWGRTQNPSVAVDASGNALAVWAHFQLGTENRFNARASRYEVGTGWVGKTLIELGTETVTGPEVVMNATGDAIATWGGRYVTERDASNPTLTDGWIQRTPSTSLGDASSAGLGIAIPDTGEGLAGWSEDEGGGQRSVWVSRYDPNAPGTPSTTGYGWSTPVQIQGPTTMASTQVRVAMNATGSEAVAIWAQGGSNDKSVYASRYTAADGWSTPESIDDASAVGDRRDPVLAMDDDGNAVAAWRRDDAASIGFNYSIWANVLEPSP